MSESLVLFGGDSPDAPVQWRWVASDGRVLAPQVGAMDQPAPLGSLTDLGGTEVTLVLPGYLVTAIETPLNARTERQALAAAPFAVEDDLATDPDNLHFALTPRRQSPRGDAPADPATRAVLAIDRALMQAWLDALTALGSRPRAVLPDYLALPDGPAADAPIATLGTDRHLILRHWDWGTAIDADLAATVAPAVMATREPVGDIHHLAGPTHGVPDLQAVPSSPPSDPLDLLASGAAKAGHGLLQGEFTARARSTEGLSLGALRWPAAMAAAANLILSGVNLAEGLSLRAETADIRAGTEAMFLDAFPDTGRVVNIRAQLRQVTQGTGANRADFLILSGYIAAGLDAVDAVSVESLRFDSDQGEVNASLLFDSYDALSRFRTAVEAAGGRVVEGGSRQVGNRRAGDIKVTLS